RRPGNTAAAQGGGRRYSSPSARLGVVDDGVVVILVPDSNPQLVHPAPAGLLAVPCRHNEAIAAGPVDGAGTLELGLGDVHDQPVVAGALEAEVSGRELEVGLTLRDRVRVLVLDIAAEVRLPGERA